MSTIKGAVAVVGSTARATAIAQICQDAGRQVVTVPDEQGDPLGTLLAGVGGEGDEIGLVIEATDRDAEPAAALVRELSRHVPGALAATTAVTRSVTALAGHWPEPGRVAGLHFIDPVDTTRLVEVVAALTTDRDTLDLLVAFVGELGREAVEVRDRPGFLVDRLLRPYLNDVIQAYDDGLATAADIDVAIELGLGYPVGPLALLDAIGIDRHLEVTSALHRASGDPQFAPPALLTRMVEAGYMGGHAEAGFRSLEEETS